MEKGRLCAFCPSPRLLEVERDIQSRLEAGEIGESIYARYLKDFSYASPYGLELPSSVFILASPIGRARIDLDLGDRKLEAIIPPTYCPEELMAENTALLGTMLSDSGSHCQPAWLPLKSLAARTGLGRYGRDNILRFEGAGSYVRLDAWWTDVDAAGESWGPAQVLDRCKACGACTSACPNGCFTHDRFLVDASKCLTSLNEAPGPFPTWLDPHSHNAAIGCLLCQEACPENKGVRGQQVEKNFSLDKEATARLLDGCSSADLPSEAAAALRAAELSGKADILARNLRALAHGRSLYPKRANSA